MIDEDLEKWTHIAGVYGWNELVKNAQTLGERVFFRMAGASSEKWLAAHGVTVPKSEGNRVILEIPHGRVTMQFRESDYELMRKALAEHDAKGGK